MENYVNHILWKRIHKEWEEEMCINLWIMWITMVKPDKYGLFECV